MFCVGRTEIMGVYDILDTLLQVHSKDALSTELNYNVQVNEPCVVNYK